MLSPDGKRSYVNHIRSATVDIVDVEHRRVVARIGGLADALSSDEALSPDGQQPWAAHKKAGKVSVIDNWPAANPRPSRYRICSVAGRLRSGRR